MSDETGQYRGELLQLLKEFPCLGTKRGAVKVEMTRDTIEAKRLLDETPKDTPEATKFCDLQYTLLEMSRAGRDYFRMTPAEWEKILQLASSAEDTLSWAVLEAKAIRKLVTGENYFISLPVEQMEQSLPARRGRFSPEPEAPSASDFRIYPNPNRGVFTVESPLGGSLTVYSADGRLVYSGEIGASATEVSLPPASGLYFVRLVSGAGVRTARVVVK